jgi:hypothetical protein
LQKSGYGAFWDELNQERIESFLFNLAEYKKNLSTYPREGNGRLLAKLDELIAELVAPPQAGADAST